jgi:hypothetical protein
LNPEPLEASTLVAEPEASVPDCANAGVMHKPAVKAIAEQRRRVPMEPILSARTLKAIQRSSDGLSGRLFSRMHPIGE